MIRAFFLLLGYLICVGVSNAESGTSPQSCMKQWTRDSKTMTDADAMARYYSCRSPNSTEVETQEKPKDLNANSNPSPMTADEEKLTVEQSAKLNAISVTTSNASSQSKSCIEQWCYVGLYLRRNEPSCPAFRRGIS
jgi:hypothetical protein